MTENENYLQQDVRRAIDRILEDHGCDVTKFVLVAEVRHPARGDLAPSLYVETSNDTPLWDSMGLLAYVAGMDHADIASRARLAEPR